MGKFIEIMSIASIVTAIVIGLWVALVHFMIRYTQRERGHSYHYWELAKSFWNWPFVFFWVLVMYYVERFKGRKIRKKYGLK